MTEKPSTAEQFAEFARQALDALAAPAMPAYNDDQLMSLDALAEALKKENNR